MQKMNETNLNKKLATRWEETRKIWLKRFILQYAILRFWTVFGMFCYLVDYVTQQTSRTYRADFLLLCVFVFGLGWAILGLWFWYFMEKNYKKYLTI